MNLKSPGKKITPVFQMETKNKISGVILESKQKYIFLGTDQGEILIYENSSQFNNKLLLIDKLEFHSSINKITSTNKKDHFGVICKENCLAFVTANNVRNRFILKLSNELVNGIVFHPTNNYFFSFGNDKTIRLWTFSNNLYSSNSENRFIRNWNKDKIFDVLSVSNFNKKYDQKKEIVHEEIHSGVSSNSEDEPLVQKHKSFKTYGDDLPKIKDSDLESKNSIFGSFKKVINDVNNIDYKSKLGSFLEDKVPAPYKTEANIDENSAAARYGLKKVQGIETLCVSNSEEEKEEEDKRNNIAKVEDIKEIKENIDKNNKIKPNIKSEFQENNKSESEEEEDDDELTGWF